VTPCQGAPISRKNSWFPEKGPEKSVRTNGAAPLVQLLGWTIVHCQHRLMRSKKPPLTGQQKKQITAAATAAAAGNDTPTEAEKST
jgi:hypothetical protein